MAFVWEETIAQDSVIENADIEEIRENCDWLNSNNNYCSTHYATHYSGNYTGYHSTQNTSVNGPY